MRKIILYFVLLASLLFLLPSHSSFPPTLPTLPTLCLSPNTPHPKVYKTAVPYQTPVAAKKRQSG